MERQKERATPRETVMERPDLVIGLATNNIAMRKGAGYVYVLLGMRECPATGTPYVLGEHFTLDQVRPDCWTSYTGPLTPELLANILIYG